LANEIQARLGTVQELLEKQNKVKEIEHHNEREYLEAVAKMDQLREKSRLQFAELSLEFAQSQ
jgi:hypothetical protein